MFCTDKTRGRIAYVKFQGLLLIIYYSGLKIELLLSQETKQNY